jgi:hypothetical protein
VLGDQPSQYRNLIIQAASEVRLSFGANTGRVANEADNGAAVINIVAVSLRQIIFYVAPKRSGRFIYRRPGGLSEFGSPFRHC